MILLVGLAVIVASVPLAGGSFRGLDSVHIHGAWLLAVTVVAQQAALGLDDGWLPRTLHVGSFAFAAIFLASNRGLRGTRWIAAGGGLNLVAVLANGGVMPAWSRAWALSGAPTIAAHSFSNARPIAGARLQPLGDVIPFPRSVPGSAPFSVGDVLVLIGCALTIHALCGSRWATRTSHVAHVAGGPPG